VDHLKDNSTQKTVLETILGWSQERPAWQRDALRRIVGKGKLDDNDIAELVSLCKQGRGGGATGIKASPFEKAHLPANPGAGASIALLAIKEVDGANILAPSQTMSFASTGLTVIYGDNGAGKSGYARILKRACRARHRGKIHGNIYAQQPSGSATATIEYSIGGKAQPPEKWQDSEHPHATLSAVSVFDTDCASVHIGKQNEVAFRPFGLDVPDELADVCQRVKEVLTAEHKQQVQARNPLFLKPTLKQTTAVGKALAALEHDTDAAQLTALATLTEEDKSRLSKLKEDLTKDPAKAAAEQKAKADNIKGALDAIARIEAATTDEALKSIFALDRDAKAKRDAARVAAENAFSGEQLTGIGAEAWRTLWDAARRYSLQTAYPAQPFPAVYDDALCVLCQQPLGGDAKERLSRFEKFIREDTERQAQEAEKLASASLKKLIDQSITTRPFRPNLREILLEDPALAKRVCRFVVSARSRRQSLLNALATSLQQPTLSAAASNPRAAIAQLETGMRKYVEELKQSANAEERKKLETELSELSDRSTLHDIMPVVKEEIGRLKAIYFLGQCLTDTTTNAITKLGNEIAKTLVTPQLRDRFQKEIVKLAAEKVRVEIVHTGGRFGSPEYRVRFFANPTAEVADVLSEGEKTCVALAAFLTELATATHSSTLVFDDPVSSLDHRWRKKVAERLAEEATHRQIIIFTHDLVFLHNLKRAAHDNQGSSNLITLTTTSAGAGVVREGLPWGGQRIEHRIDELEKQASTAKAKWESGDEEAYRHDAVGIYGRIRAAWEKALEDVAFQRVITRFDSYIDKHNLRKVVVFNDVDCNTYCECHQKCSGITEAHEPSAAENGAAPAPTEMSQDIQKLKDWVASLRDRQKMIQ